MTETTTTPRAWYIPPVGLMPPREFTMLLQGEFHEGGKECPPERHRPSRNKCKHCMAESLRRHCDRQAANEQIREWEDE